MLNLLWSNSKKINYRSALTILRFKTVFTNLTLDCFKLRIGIITVRKKTQKKSCTRSTALYKIIFIVLHRYFFAF